MKQGLDRRVEEMKEAQKLADLAHMVDAGAAAKYQDNEVIERTAKVKTYEDSLQHYAEMDSIIRSRISAGADAPKDVYKTQFFCKATFGEMNVMDTMTLMFDNEFRTIDYTRLP